MTACGGSEPALEKTDFETGEFRQTKKVSIYDLKAMYTGSPTVIDEDIRIEGRIVSSDMRKNIYNSVVIEDETGAIEIRIEKDKIYSTYKKWYVLSVSCNSLVLSSYGGLLQLGEGIGATSEMSSIPAYRLESVMSLQENTWAEVLPTTITMADLSGRYLSCFVRIENVQFIDEEVGMAWCDTGVNTNRHVVNTLGDTLVVRTNNHATFANHILPSGSGYIQGILGYFNRDFQISVVDWMDAEMGKPRFTPHP